MFKKSVFSSTVLGACLAFSVLSPAKAGLALDFTDEYDVSNWTTTISGGDGSVDLTGAPASIALTSSNDGSFSFQTVDFTIAAIAGGLVSFGWNFTTNDNDGPLFDPFGYLLNSTFFQLTNDSGSNNQSGPVSFAVNAGDIFGFRQVSLDSGFGAATTTISNFSAPSASAVPEPASLALLGIGLAGLGFMRRRRT